MKKASELLRNPLAKTLIILVICLSISLGGFTVAFGYGHRYIPNPAETPTQPPEIVVPPVVPPVVPVVPPAEVIVPPVVAPVVPVIQFNEPPVVPQVLGETVYAADELIPTVKYGQRGQSVRDLQTELKRMGFLAPTWSVTAFYGANTSAAVKKYQAYKKIVGTETAKTIKTLITNTRFGSRSTDIRQLQTELRKLGLFNMLPTGYYGRVTQAAVKAYQAIK